MTVVVVPDASAVVAMLLDSGSAGTWSAAALDVADLAAPALMRFEASNIIRRHEAAGLIPAGDSAQAHASLLDLPVQQWPYEALAQGVREHQQNLTVYDASYVALAELLGATLVTLDQRIARAPGVRCAVSVPGRGSG